MSHRLDVSNVTALRLYGVVLMDQTLWYDEMGGSSVSFVSVSSGFVVKTATALNGIAGSWFI